MKKTVKTVILAAISTVAAATVIATSAATISNTEKSNLNVVIDNASGDTHSASAELTITKKDGSEFVSDIKDTYIAIYSDFTTPYAADYTFQDNSTITVNVTCDNEEELSDSILNISEKKACIFHVDKVIYTEEEFRRLRENPDDEFWADNLNILQKAEKAYGTLAENQQASMINGDIVIVTWEEVPFEYDLAINLK